MRFGHGRKTKNGENSISATAETEIMPQNGFPTPWKWGKCLKNGFLTPWKWGKSLKNGFPIPWKWGKASKTFFQPLGSKKGRCFN